MTVVNPVNDNEFYWAAWANAWANAFGAGGIVSGCSISKGSGDWDIDVTSGTIIESNTEASITADTETITDSSALGTDAEGNDESRITLITANTGDTISSTDGSAAVKPATPDIPANEVLLGFVVVTNGDSTAADSDIFDVPALRQNDSALYDVGGSYELTRDPLYGDGSDGAKTVSSNETLNGVKFYEDFTVQAGNTVTVNNILWVFATGTIDISGTIDGNGNGASGGSGGAPGGNGSGADFSPLGTGGSGGAGGGSGTAGGDGGDGDTFTPSVQDLVRMDIASAYKEVQKNGANLGGAGGGGGGDAIISSEGNGQNGSSPGGGGGGGGETTGSAGSGGDGGDGGAGVILVAPEINVSGTITMQGTDGQDGTADSASGGGGGGGSGGPIVLVSPNISVGGTTDTSGGSGGTGPDGGGDQGDGGDGANGANGPDLRVTT